MLWKKVVMIGICFCLIMGGAVTKGLAHGVWLDQAKLVLGEGRERNCYSPEAVKWVQGLTANYWEGRVQVIPGKKGVRVNPSPDVAVVAIFFDYGYWTKDQQGVMHHSEFKKVAGAVKNIHAIKYNVSYLSSVLQPQAAPGVPLQIVPLTDPMSVKVGQNLPVQVILNGRPFGGAELVTDVLSETSKTVRADQEGKAEIPVTHKGLQVVGIEVEGPATVQRNVTCLDMYFSTLSFQILSK